MKTVKDIPAFCLSFLIPDLRPHFETKPADIIAHFIGHEGKGSVCAYLKKKGWIIDLSAGPTERPRYRCAPMFDVEGTLTRDGYGKQSCFIMATAKLITIYALHRDFTSSVHYQEVLHAIFEYIALLRSSSFEPYHFSEISTMSQIRFRFKEKVQPSDHVNSLSFDLSEPSPVEEILRIPSVIQKWDEALVKNILDLLVPEKSRAILKAREHDEEVVGKDAKWETERWYGTQYCVQRLNESLFQRVWSSLVEMIFFELTIVVLTP